MSKEKVGPCIATGALKFLEYEQWWITKAAARRERRIHVEGAQPRGAVSTPVRMAGNGPQGSAQGLRLRGRLGSARQDREACRLAQGLAVSEHQHSTMED
jgi:hypothetical protein